MKLKIQLKKHKENRDNIPTYLDNLKEEEKIK